MVSAKRGKILIVDDNEHILSSLRLFLKNEFGSIETLRNPNLIPSQIETNDYDIVLLDMNFKAGVNTGNEGIFWLRKIHEIDPAVIIILITAYGDVELAVKAMKEGATDFIQKPWDNDRLLAILKTALNLRESKREIKKLQNQQQILSEGIDRHFPRLIGDSPAMQTVMNTINKISATDANVMILGENGTGKELIAREIHRRSLRAKEVFVTVDMAALSETLFESELFGHVKGAFTDAREDRPGRFEVATGGTLFLDEIGNLPVTMQSKILTSLQSREVTRIGSTKAVNIDVRIISATNKHPGQMVQEGKFREDLLYRINTIVINLPPLRERGNDILQLARFFLQKYTNKYDKKVTGISKDAEHKIFMYHWPGNVRELQHAIEKAVILTERDVLQPDDFFLNIRDEENPEENSLNLAYIEKNTIIKALRKHRGNLTHAARELGITRTTLYSKINKYGI
ncbi:MAG TPA: sigma-54 dependent transcriptional regulator [Bacteroidales bacterium]|nr:sigma-54 dependent transcriptional regulator [Bacteroidales bacterium]